MRQTSANLLINSFELSLFKQVFLCENFKDRQRFRHLKLLHYLKPFRCWGWLSIPQPTTQGALHYFLSQNFDSHVENCCIFINSRSHFNQTSSYLLTRPVRFKIYLLTCFGGQNQTLQLFMPFISISRKHSRLGSKLIFQNCCALH